MYAVSDYQFWVAGIGFLVALFFSFYLPGLLVMKRIDPEINIRNILLALCVGFVLWTMQGFIFGYLQIRWMSYVYLLGIILLSISSLPLLQESFKYTLQKIKNEKIITIILILGMFLQSMVMFSSGIVSNEGILFQGANGIDGIMHLNYIQSMMNTFPPIEPGASQLALKNYHYWFDLNIAELARVWHLPHIHIFFQFIPLFISLITGIATFLLMRIWTRSKVAGLWGLFFLYLGGDAAYLFMLGLHNTFGFHTPAIDNGIAQFFNMPHAAAKMLFLAALIPFYYWIKTKEKKWGILTVLLLSSLIGYKVYFGIFAALGFTLVIIGTFIASILHAKQNLSFSKRIKKALRMNLFPSMLLLIYALISAIIYFPPNSGSGGLQYFPLEWPKQFLGQNNLDIREWWLRMQVYEEAGNIRNIFFYNAFAILVTLICIHGTRLIGLFPTKRLFKSLGWEHMVFFLPGIVIFHILGFTTLQVAGSFNVFNFFVVSTTVMALFSAHVLYELTMKKSVLMKVAICIIVLVTVPRAFYEVYSATKNVILHKGAVINSQEFKALQYIRENTPYDTIVQSHPANALDSETPYVSYLSGRNSFLSGNTMIGSHGQPIEPLEKELQTMFYQPNQLLFTERLKKNNIAYIYLLKVPEQTNSIKQQPSYLTKFYENSEVIIYKIEQE